MIKLTKEHIEQIEQNTNFSVSDEGEYYEFSWYTNAGEDYSFIAYKDNLINDIISYAEDFDPEEHALSWVGGRGAPGIRVLLEDADEIQEELNKLADLVKDFKFERFSVYDLNLGDSVADFDTMEEAEQFITEDKGEHNLEIQSYLEGDF